ncbi:MAG: nicotinamide-nucleotide adenylyltransferase [Thermoprotei archaeon]
MVGRFQPFHLGHLKAVIYAFSLCETLYIGVGSSQESGTERNPFDSELRKKMIRESLEEMRLWNENLKLLDIPDFLDDQRWFDFIKRSIPDLQVVFSGNPWVRRIFKERGISVVTPPWYNRGEVSGTRIRKLMREGGKWEGLVPHAVIDVIQEQLEALKRSRPKLEADSLRYQRTEG